MMIKIKDAKGKKDRYVQIAEGVLNLLRSYYLEEKRKTWLFEAQRAKQYSADSISKVIKKSALKANIKKLIYPHILRHSDATHNLEQGIDIRFYTRMAGT